MAKDEILFGQAKSRLRGILAMYTASRGDTAVGQAYRDIEGIIETVTTSAQLADAVREIAERIPASGMFSNGSKTGDEFKVALLKSFCTQISFGAAVSAALEAEYEQQISAMDIKMRELTAEFEAVKRAADAQVALHEQELRMLKEQMQEKDQRTTRLEAQLEAKDKAVTEVATAVAGKVAEQMSTQMQASMDSLFDRMTEHGGSQYGGGSVRSSATTSGRARRTVDSASMPTHSTFLPGLSKDKVGEMLKRKGMVHVLTPAKSAAIKALAEYHIAHPKGEEQALLKNIILDIMMKYDQPLAAILSTYQTQNLPANLGKIVTESAARQEEDVQARLVSMATLAAEKGSTNSLRFDILSALFEGTKQYAMLPGHAEIVAAIKEQAKAAQGEPPVVATASSTSTATMQ